MSPIGALRIFLFFVVAAVAIPVVAMTILVGIDLVAPFMTALGGGTFYGFEARDVILTGRGFFLLATAMVAIPTAVILGVGISGRV
ncbi:hypothetical protein [Halorubrum ezzemoulense]|uniref:Uncharacterized protein n=1 Tax=Halorubrum ezzemoulense TaxID=337243 RepID=A0A256JXC2_HALEZ|nr:hypothetical protein [Halorubrum ezzemoulense]OYR73186.1 hypothetical protein DJ76_10315 [Halorubrum ezzemoulense]